MSEAGKQEARKKAERARPKARRRPPRRRGAKREIDAGTQVAVGESARSELRAALQEALQRRRPSGADEEVRLQELCRCRKINKIVLNIGAGEGGAGHQEDPGRAERSDRDRRPEGRHHARQEGDRDLQDHAPAARSA